MNRRDFTKGILATATSFALLESLFAYEAIGKNMRPILDHWANELNTYCLDLNKTTITAAEWQAKTEMLFNRVELQEIVSFIDFDQLIRGFEFPDLGVSTKMVKFPKLEGLPERTAFIKKIFGMKKDRAIIPHGHSNMASAHLILKGDMHLRHYEKTHQDEQNLIIKPTIDKIITTGECSSISDEKNNVHWFISDSESSFTFDVIMLDLNEKHYDIHNLDIYAAQDLKNGTLRAPIIDVQTALKKYGKHHH